MKRLILIVLLAAILAAGCTSEQQVPVPAESPADALFMQAGKAFASDNFHAAADLYGQAYGLYKAEGSADRAKDALNKRSVSVRMYAEFPFNRSVMTAMIEEEFPAVPKERKENWLSCKVSQCIESNGETWYFVKRILLP